MFIYEFMGGVMDAIKTDTDIDEEDYDPHHHRIVEHPTSYSETMTHMLKGSIGAGILAMPDGFRRMGLIAGATGLFAIGGLCTYCIHMLVTAQYVLCKRNKKGYMSYSNSIKTAIISGPPCLRGTASVLAHFVDVILIVWQLGLCCVYSVFVAENVKQVCDYYGLEISIRLHVLIGFVPLLILNMVKNLKLLSPLSSVSNVVTMLGLILVFFYLMETDLVIESNMFKPKSLEDFPVFVGITLFALEAVGVEFWTGWEGKREVASKEVCVWMGFGATTKAILALEFNMENPKKFKGCCGLFNVAMTVILGLYCLVGAFGYMKYGADIQASITLNLPFYDKKAQAAKILLALAIAMTHPLQNFVAYNQIWIGLSKRYEGSKKVAVDYSLRVILVIIPVAMAVAVPTLGPIISLVGALCLSLLAVVFPALMDVCIWYPDKYGLLKYKLFRDILIIVLGIFSLLSGVYTSVLEILQSTVSTS